MQSAGWRQSPHSVALLATTCTSIPVGTLQPAADCARQEFRRGGVDVQHAIEGLAGSDIPQRRCGQGTRSWSGRPVAMKAAAVYVTAYSPTPASFCGGFRWFPNRVRRGPKPWPTRAPSRSAVAGSGRSVLRSGGEPRLFRHRQPGAHVRPAGTSRGRNCTPARSYASTSIPAS